MRAILILVTLTLVSCNHKARRYVCSCEQRMKVQEFVERSIKPANNMSDEEMEDVVKQLYITGVEMNCENRLIETDSNWNPITPLDSCEFYHLLY